MYIFLDTETGGLGVDKTLLTVSLIHTDQNFNLTGLELNLKLKPDDGIYLVEPRALGINKIDLVEHDKEAVTYQVVKSNQILYRFLKDCSEYNRVNSTNKLTVVGKNVWTDLVQLWNKLISRGAWESFVSYSQLDISSIWKYLELIGKVPILPKTSLVNIAEYLGVDNSRGHEAFGDCLMGIEIMKKIKELK